MKGFSRRTLLRTSAAVGGVTALGLPASGAMAQERRDYVSLVDPWVEADIGRYFFFQSATNPFGLVKLRPDTSTGAAWGTGYRKNENLVKGFSHIHEWTLSGVQIMPTTGTDVPKLQGDTGWQSHVEHDSTEVAEPGYHKLHLDRYGIGAELTVTDRVGLHRYTYGAAGPSEIIINLGGQLGEALMERAQVARVSDRELEGHVVEHAGMTQVYFTITFDRPFDSMRGWADGSLVDGGAPVDRMSGGDSGVYVRYDHVDAGEQIQMKVALSYTGTDGARRNQQTELPGWNFDAVKAASQARWNQLLGRIDVGGGTQQQQIKFYTDLFHVLCGRGLASDADGKYLDDTWDHNQVKQLPLGRDGKPKFAMYNYDALWLTQWNVNSILGLAYPEIYSSFIHSQLQVYRDGGLLPRGPAAGDDTAVMTGSPVTSFISGAWNKGIQDFDINLAYDAMLDAQSIGGLYDKAWFDYGNWGTGGNREYLDLGYVPNGLTGQGAGQTLEYAYQDWTLAQLAHRLGKTGLNAAQFAEVSVSSQLDDSVHAGVRAIDGRPARAPAPTEWASAGERTPWIKLAWSRPRRVRRVVLSDRADPASNVNSGILTFSDGSAVKVNRIPADGTPRVVDFGWKRVDWVKFQVTGGSGTDVGLDEFEVWDDTDVHQYLMDRSDNWRNLFDRSTGFIRPRKADGQWRTPFDPLAPSDFVEANSWQASWFTVQDVMGLANLLGGPRAYADKLDYAFKQAAPFNFIGDYGDGYVSYGNQPGLEVAHLFNYVGYPWLTQYWVRQVKEKTYGAIATDDGYGHHDEDQGQMGALSALMAIGLFEVTGGALPRPVYDITSPVFDTVTISLSRKYHRGKTFRIVTHNNSATNMYIQAAKLDGRALENAWFYHDQLTDGGTLELWLGPQPNTNWGVAQLPPSQSKPAPAVTFVTPDVKRVDHGSAVTVGVAAQNLTDRPVTVSWRAPQVSGIEVIPSAGSLQVPAGQSVSQEVTVRVAAETPRGVYRLVFSSHTAGGGQLPPAIAYLNVAPAVSVRSAAEQFTLLQATPATVQLGLSNNDADQTHRVDVGAVVPDGWTVQPASRAVELPPGGNATTTFTIIPAAGASGAQSVTFTASGDWGTSQQQVPASVSRKVALLGDIDISTAGFALSPNHYGDYPARFPNDVDFTIGTDDPATGWSYIHPGPGDAWAGSSQHTFTLRFDLAQVPDHGLALTAWLVDTHESGPPTIQLSLNGGPTTTAALTPGGGDGYHWGDGAGNVANGIRPSVLDAALPADQLKPGRNSITITNAAGSWMVYDAIGIRELEETPPEQAPQVTSARMLLSE